MEEMLNK